MGIRLFSTGGERQNPAAVVPDRNPDPERFNIIRTHAVGSYVCAMIDYVNCTNYEGKKIIVFEETTAGRVMDSVSIDPHFMEDGNVIARFRPDDEGWDDAVSYIQRKARWGDHE